MSLSGDKPRFVADDAYREFAPPPELARHVACVWIERSTTAGPYRDRVPADGFVDLVWGQHLWVRGPDTRAHGVSYGPGWTLVGVRFRPGTAVSVLDVAANELIDRRVALYEIWGPAADRLVERLTEARSASEAARLLTDAVLERARQAAPPDAVVRTVVDALRERPARQRIAALADEVGLTERQLLRRCRTALGYGPKTLDRASSAFSASRPSPRGRRRSASLSSPLSRASSIRPT
jgi:AraC-like DNA-binding protein